MAVKDEQATRVHPDEALALISKGRWPAHAIVDGDLNIGDDPAIASLPSDLTIDGWLIVMGSPTLSSIPDGVRAFGLMVGNCPEIATIGAIGVPGGACDRETLDVTGDVLIERCPKLVGITAKALRIGGEFSVQECPAFGRSVLPDRILVKRNMRLGGCLSLPAMPCDLDVRGALGFDHCGLPSRIPLEGATWRVDCGISLHACRSLEAIGPNLRFRNGAFVGLDECPLLRTVDCGPLPESHRFVVRDCPKLDMQRIPGRRSASAYVPSP